jgi:hypothetical protein
MKTRKSTAASLVSIILILLFAVSVSFAGVQEKSKQTDEFKFNEREIADLERGISSQNEGVKKSSIYLAGLYNIAEASDALLNQLKVEENPDVRILIALVLYRIGDDNSIQAVKDLSVKDENAKVRRMSSAIVKEFDLNKLNDSETITGMLLHAE